MNGSSYLGFVRAHGLRFLAIDLTVLGWIVVVSAALGGGILAATGILFLARPRTQYWWAIVVLVVGSLTQTVLEIPHYASDVTALLYVGWLGCDRPAGIVTRVSLSPA